MRIEANPGRAIAAAAFRTTLDAHFGKAAVSEKDFAEYWLAEMTSHHELSSTGWYEPPPNGCSVLAASSRASERISFGSLRDEEFWPGQTIIDWEDGLLYAYASPVHLPTGLPGDFAVTLYLGSDARVREHFLSAYRATGEVVAMIRPSMTSRELFEDAERVFAEAGLKNSVVSVTDSTPLDLGHTLPRLSATSLTTRALSREDCEFVRRGRKFINADDDWALESVDQFTIEPQLLSVEDSGLPQISFHYVVVLPSLALLDEGDSFFRRFELV